jgi:hypothetical protein
MNNLFIIIYLLSSSAYINVPHCWGTGLSLWITHKGHNPPRGSSAERWVLMTVNAAGTYDLTCLPKHGGARDTKFLVTQPMTDQRFLTSAIASTSSLYVLTLLRETFWCSGFKLFPFLLCSYLKFKFYFLPSRFVGVFELVTPMVFIRDIDLMKQVLIKDSEHFLDHRTMVDDKVDPLWGRNLLSLKGR